MSILFAKPRTKIAYLSIAKIATSSIRRTFLESEEVRGMLDREVKKNEGDVKKNFSNKYFINSVFRNQAGVEEKYKKDLVGIKGMRYDASKNWVLSGYEQGEGFSIKPISTEEINSYFIFTFVRNPFTRLVSCFQNKYNYDGIEKKFISELGDRKKDLPAEVKDFQSFILQINQMPPDAVNPHAKAQTILLHGANKRGVRPNFVGKFENLAVDFEPIRQKYGLLSLEVQNKSKPSAQHKKWQDYYTPELAHIVYERYLDDFKHFGYEGEYPKLLAHLNAPLPWRFRKRKLLAQLGFKSYKKHFQEKGH
jgi:hypothetical protein